jgi:hypothetical protein
MKMMTHDPPTYPTAMSPCSWGEGEWDNKNDGDRDRDAHGHNNRMGDCTMTAT